MSTILVVDVPEGVEEERQPTADEQAALDIDAQAHEQWLQAKADALAAREAALAKLAALGLTVDDLAALGL